MKAGFKLAEVRKCLMRNRKRGCCGQAGAAVASGDARPNAYIMPSALGRKVEMDGT